MATDERFLIWSIEHFAWWRPSEVGYTPNLREAGIYDRDTAGRIVQNANRVKVNECAIPYESVVLPPVPAGPTSATASAEKEPLLFALINAIGTISKDEAIAGIFSNQKQILAELVGLDPGNHHNALQCPFCFDPPNNDEAIVMRFRELAGVLIGRLPLEHFRDEKERRSTVLSMMLRATTQELLAHLGPNHKAMAFVFSSELQRAMDEAIDAKNNPVTKN